jgi:hypothetical protein
MEMVSLMLQSVYPQERAIGIHRTGGFVGPTPILHMKRKIVVFLSGFELTYSH